MTTSTILRNWDAPRVFRAALALIFLVAGLAEHEPMALALSAVLGLQAAFNVGCCGAACARPDTNAQAESRMEVEYEEIKGK